MRSLHLQTSLLVALSAAATAALAGCAAGQGWPALLTVLLSSGALALVGCGSSHGRDGAGRDAGPVADAGRDGGALDAGGSWDPCCVDGVIDSCYCPPMTACNYGWFDDCGDGTCADFGECPGGDGGLDAGPADAGPPDAGGRWETCCVDGVIDTCFCPAGVACNYGWFTDCGGGACAFTPDECPPDGGATDASTTLDAGAGG